MGNEEVVNATEFGVVPRPSLLDEIYSKHLSIITKVDDKGIQKEHSVDLFRNLDVLKEALISEILKSNEKSADILKQINAVYTPLEGMMDIVLAPNVSLVEVSEATENFYDRFYENKFSPNTKKAIFSTLRALALLTVIAGFTIGAITLNPIVAGIATLMIFTGVFAFLMSELIAERRFGLQKNGSFFTSADTLAKLIKTNLMELAKIIRNPVNLSSDIDNSTQEPDLDSEQASKKYQ